MSAHTPGPWERDGMRIGASGYLAYIKRQRYLGGPLAIAKVANGGDHPDATSQYAERPQDEAEANAKLIVAAPDLLAACEDAVEELRTDENYVGENGGEAEFLVKLRAAIAKARGQ